MLDAVLDDALSKPLKTAIWLLDALVCQKRGVESVYVRRASQSFGRALCEIDADDVMA